MMGYKMVATLESKGKRLLQLLGLQLTGYNHCSQQQLQQGQLRIKVCCRCTIIVILHTVAARDRPHHHHDRDSGGCPQHVPDLSFPHSLLRQRPGLCLHPPPLLQDEFKPEVESSKVRRMVWRKPSEESTPTNLCRTTKAEELVAEELKRYLNICSARSS